MTKKGLSLVDVILNRGMTDEHPRFGDIYRAQHDDGRRWVYVGVDSSDSNTHTMLELGSGQFMILSSQGLRAAMERVP